MNIHELPETQIVEQFYSRLFEESVPRIKICLSKLDLKDVWYSPNEQLNSIGNLILHLDGNVRQWILSGLLGKKDNRKRHLEFIPGQNIRKEVLLSKLDTLEIDIREAMKQWNISDITKMRKVQVFEESGISIIIHVIEHFSYHTGQITFLTKLLTNEPTNYYGDLNLETNE